MTLFKPVCQDGIFYPPERIQPVQFMAGKTLTLTILSDNNAAACCSAEHGFSLFAETGESTILFDTGRENVLLSNATALGIDLSRVRQLVLSHGHYDHTGCVSQVLGLAPGLSVYMHPAAFQKRFSIRDGMPRPVNMPEHARSALKSMPREQIHLVEQPAVLSYGAGITGPVPRRSGFEDTGGPFYMDSEGTIPDPIGDDLSIWFETRDGLVLITGCCHAGIVNTLSYVTELTGTSRIAALIGGFHLSSASEERLVQTAASLNRFDIARIIACHCTGEHATMYLRRNLRCQVEPGYAGMQLQFAS
jgi:7,8-dihydropterin-6-yl-methyl-4-(beta-D-ribofuranosyl)aminobenzene 5'-phosphate synthase